MVQKLLKAAAKDTAENVILTVENDDLRWKATAAEDRVKTRSRKVLSKAQVIEVTDAVRIRKEQEARELAAAERRARAAVKQAQALPRKSRGAIPKKATPSSSRNLQTPNKRQPTAKKVVIDDSPISIRSGDSEWDGIDTEWEEGDVDARFDGVDDTIIVQPAPRAPRSTTRGQAPHV
jgi:hypothetical protein